MKKLNHTIILLFILTHILYSKNISTDMKNIELINITSQQRMLSQRITKAYLYAGNRVATDKANRELRRALIKFKKISQKLNKKIKNPELKRIVGELNESCSRLSSISQRPLNQANAKSILRLSETILRKSTMILQFFNRNLQKGISNPIIKSGQQRMLTQKIAKYYIAYQSGIKDKATHKYMKESVELFIRNHQALMKNRRNTPLIKKKLEEIDKLWKIVYNFYFNMKSGELPLIVFDSTNNISKKMDEITKLYIATYRVSKK